MAVLAVPNTGRSPPGNGEVLTPKLTAVNVSASNHRTGRDGLI